MKYLIGMILAAVFVAAPGGASAQSVPYNTQAWNAADWLSGNGSSILVFESGDSVSFFAFQERCGFQLEFRPAAGPPSVTRIRGSFANAMAARSGAAVQFFTPSGQAIEIESEGVHYARYSRNTHIYPVRHTNDALAEQFVRNFNIVSQACGGPGRP